MEITTTFAVTIENAKTVYTETRSAASVRDAHRLILMAWFGAEVEFLNDNIEQEETIMKIFEVTWIDDAGLHNWTNYYTDWAAEDAAKDLIAAGFNNVKVNMFEV